MRLKERHF